MRKIQFDMFNCLCLAYIISFTVLKVDYIILLTDQTIQRYNKILINNVFLDFL